MTSIVLEISIAPLYKHDFSSMDRLAVGWRRFYCPVVFTLADTFFHSFKRNARRYRISCLNHSVLFLFSSFLISLFTCGTK
jgi:hypothetical protein